MSNKEGFKIKKYSDFANCNLRVTASLIVKRPSTWLGRLMALEFELANHRA
ncbi:hypothetical protein AAOGI_10330 [Agarivorans albus]